jgi:hypothetical protein
MLIGMNGMFASMWIAMLQLLVPCASPALGIIIAFTMLGTFRSAVQCGDRYADYSMDM